MRHVKGIAVLFVLTTTAVTAGCGLAVRQSRAPRPGTGKRAAATTYAPSSPVGTLPGTFAVDGNGTATYTVPIPVPPGTAGVQPNLQLAYDHRGGDGYLGMGWSITGISAITRCGADYELDGYKSGVSYSSTDRFCVDGDRLVVVSGSYGAPGSVYHMEHETWTVFTANGACGNGPCSFSAQNKDGNALSFGATTGSTGSRVLAQGRTDGTVRTWSIDQYTDLNGNSTSVTYSNNQETGEYCPASIAYTANAAAGLAAQRAVTFNYQSRNSNDIVLRYLGGSQIMISQVLASITTSVGGSTVQTFNFQYQPSSATNRTLLTSVQACDANNVCWPATTFTWQAAPGTFATPTTSTVLPGPLYVIYGTTTYPYGILQDLNGDGIPDYAQAVAFPQADPATSNLSIWLGNGDGTFTLAPYSLPGPLFQVTATSITQCGVLADINGDGILDYSPALLNSNSNTSDYSVWLGSPDGYTQSPTITLPGPVYQIIGTESFQTGTLTDMNGDGLPDYSRATQLANGQMLLDIYQNTTDQSGGAGFTQVMNGSDAVTLPGPLFQLTSSGSQPVGILRDINGDGIPDFSAATVNSNNQQSSLTVWLGSSNFTYTSSYSLPDRMLWVAGSSVFNSGVLDDVNGDGIPDYSRATYLTANQQSLLSVSLGTGAGFAPSQFSLPEPLYVIQPGIGAIQGVLTDYNVDGTSRYSQATQNGQNENLSIYLGNGNGFTNSGVSLPGPLFNIVGTATYGVGIYQDINGDGLTDYASSTCNMNTSGSLTNCGLNVYLANGPFSDLLSTITNGFNGVTTISYSSLADSDVYTSDFTPAYPIREGSSSMYVVSGFTTSDGRGNSYGYSYSYQNGEDDVLGRDWLGFTNVIVTENAGGRQTNTTYEMMYPYYGRIASTEVLDSDGNTLELAEYTYADVAPAANQAIGIHQPVATQTVTTTYQNDSPAFSVTRQTDYDQYGNVTIESDLGDTTTNVLPKYQCVQWSNNAALNRFGYPLQRLTANSYAACQSFLSSTNPVWDPSTDLRWQVSKYDANQNVISRANWDTTQSAFLTTSYGYDAYGNTTAITGPLGTTTMAWDPVYDTFLASVSSPPLQNGQGGTYQIASSYEFEPDFGAMVQSVDPNGNVKTQSIDGFGRPVAVFGPGPGGVSAQLVSVAWVSDSTGTYLQTLTRPNWNVSDQSQWYWDRVYRDGLLRDYSWQQAGLENGQATTILRNIYFDPQGRISGQSSPYYSGDTEPLTTTLYDSYNRPIQITDPSGNVESIVYENGGLQISRTRAYGTPYATTDVANLDVLARVSAYAAANGQTTTFSYDPIGQTVGATTAPDVRTATSAFDSLGRLSTTTQPDTGTTTWSYASTGLLQSVTDGAGNSIQYTAYDPLGRVTARTATWSGGHATGTIAYAYDQSNHANGIGQLTSVAQTDPTFGTATYSFGYDAFGNAVAAETRLGGLTWDYAKEFDPLGRVNSITTPDAATTSWTYGSDMNMAAVAVQPADAPAQTYGTFSSYTALGQTQQTLFNPNGVQVTQSYFPPNVAFGRLQTITATTSQSSTLVSRAYTWNPLASVMAITDGVTPANSQTFGYTGDQANVGMSYLTNATGAYGGEIYTYQPIGNVATHNGVTYTYSANADTLQSSSNGMTYGYATNGMLNTVQNSSGTQTYTFNADGLLTQMSQTSGTTTQSYTAAYDFDGRRIYEQPLGAANPVYYVTDDFEVVALGGGNYQYTRYTEGPNGKFAATTASGSGARGTEGARHRHAVLSKLFGGKGARGRISSRYHAFLAAMLSPAAGRATGWIAVLLLGIAASFFGVLPSFCRRWPRAFGRRTAYARLHPHTAALAPLVAACFLLTIVGDARGDLTPGSNGVGVPTLGELFFIVDHIGSTIAVTDDSGNQTASVGYQPYGTIDPSSSSGVDNFRPKFSGKPFLYAPALYHFGARPFDPATGRFISPDPARQFMSPYVYANNDPASWVDPDGRFAFLIAIIIGAIIGAYLGAAAVNHSYDPLHWNWHSAKTYTAFIIGAGIGAVGAAAGGLVTEIGIAVGSAGGLAAEAAGTAIGIAGETTVGAGENAAYAALGGGTSKEIKQAAVEGALFAGIFGGMSSALRATGDASAFARAGEDSAPSDLAGEDASEDSSPCTCASSFPAGTKVLSADGTMRPIESIAVGDRLPGFTMTPGTGRVSSLHSRTTKEFVEIQLGTTSTVSTPEHRFYVKDRGWIAARDLHAGWDLATATTASAHVLGVRPFESATPRPVYNFDVDGTHSYYVSDERVLVHNPKATYCRAASDAAGTYTETWNETALKERFPDKSTYEAVRRDIRTKARNANRMIAGGMKASTRASNPVRTASKAWVKWAWAGAFGEEAVPPSSIREALEILRPRGYSQDVDESLTRLHGGLTIEQGFPENQTPMNSFANSTSGAAAKAASRGPVLPISRFAVHFVPYQ